MSGPAGGPLTIERGQARFSMLSVSFPDFEGTIGSQGGLTMRSVAPGRTQAVTRIVYVRIHGTGTLHARFLGFIP